MRRPGVGALRRAGFRGFGGSSAPSGLASLDVLSPELLLDERGQTIATGVSSWANQGTAGGAATQGTGANQPAQTTINGHACPNFDGTNDSLTTTVPASDFATTTEYEILTVVKVDTLSGSVPAAASAWYNDRSIFQSATPGNAAIGLVSTRYGVAAGKGTSPWDRSMVGPAYNDGLPHIVSQRYVGGNLITSIDGGPERSKAATTSTPLGGFLNIGVNYGGAAPFDGQIATLFARKTVLTTEERAAAIAYLANKYGVATSGKQVDVSCHGDSIVWQNGSAAYRQRLATVLGSTNGYRATGALRGVAAYAQNMVTAGNGYTVSSLRTLHSTSGLGTLWGADIHWVCIGTNDLANGASCATLRTRWLLLASDFRTLQPNALVVMSLIMPREDDTGGAVAKVAEWNADWAEPVMDECIALGNRMVLSTAMTLPGITRTDGLHPDDTPTNANILGDGLAAEYPAWRAAA